MNIEDDSTWRYRQLVFCQVRCLKEELRSGCKRISGATHSECGFSYLSHFVTLFLPTHTSSCTPSTGCRDPLSTLHLLPFHSSTHRFFATARSSRSTSLPYHHEVVPHHQNP